MGVLGDIWDWIKGSEPDDSPPSRPNRRSSGREIWICRRCNRQYSGSPICPQCRLDNSREPGVDNPADPQWVSISDWAIYTAIALALAAGFVASGGLGVIGGGAAGAGGAMKPALAIGVGLVTIGAAGPAAAAPAPASGGNPFTQPGAMPTDGKISQGDLELVSASSDPPTDKPYQPYWKIDKDAGTTHYEYQGLTANYFWKVPKRIPKGGTEEIIIRGETTAVKGNRLNATIGVAAPGLTLSPERPIVNETAEGEQSRGRTETVKVTDSTGSGDATVKVYVGYTFRFDYVYRRVP